MADITITINGKDATKSLNDTVLKLLCAALCVKDPLADTIVNQMTNSDNGKKVANAKRVAFAKSFASLGKPTDVFVCVQKGKKDDKESSTTGTGSRAVVAARMLLASEYENYKIEITRNVDGKSEKVTKDADADLSIEGLA